MQSQFKLNRLLEDHTNSLASRLATGIALSGTQFNAQAVVRQFKILRGIESSLEPSVRLSDAARLDYDATAPLLAGGSVSAYKSRALSQAFPEVHATAFSALRVMPCNSSAVSRILAITHAIALLGSVNEWRSGHQNEYDGLGSAQ